MAGLSGIAGAVFGDSLGSGGSAPAMTGLNPASNALAALFGQSWSQHNGWVPPRGTTVEQNLANQFAGTPFAGLPDIISQYTQRSMGGGSPAEQQLYSQLFETGLLGDRLNSALGNLDFATAQARTGAETGFAVDPTPLYNEAIRRFNTSVLPQVAETSGLGLQSSGFLNLAGREASNLLGQASTQAVQLANDAAQRRLLSIPALSQAAAGGLALPTSFATDVGSAANALRSSSLGPVNLFAQLAGLTNNLPFNQQGYPTTNATSDLIGTLGSVLPFILAMA